MLACALAVSGCKMSGRNSIGALLRRVGKCERGHRSFMASAVRGHARGAGREYAANFRRSWSSRGVLAIAGAAGLLGWGIAQAQNGNQDGTDGTSLLAAGRKRRYATVEEMENVSAPVPLGPEPAVNLGLYRLYGRLPWNSGMKMPSPRIRRICAPTATRSGRQ